MNLYDGEKFEIVADYNIPPAIRGLPANDAAIIPDPWTDTRTS